MSANSAIEWTSATWNPIAGCSVLSPGCTHCYAMKMAARIEKMQAALGKPTPYAGLTQPSKAGPVWNGRIAVAPDEVLTQPLRWKRPRRIFVNSMSDLFHEGVADETIDKVFAVMALCPQHTFQVLTKRAARMREYVERAAPRIVPALINSPGTIHESIYIDDKQVWPLPNVWLGVSTEDQARADERIPHLLATPAAKRFISAEPLLGAVDLNRILLKKSDAPERGKPDLTMSALRGWYGGAGDPAKLDWVIAGGESGPKARPSHPDWFRSLRDQCAAAGVPYFFKQWGEWTPEIDRDRDDPDWRRDYGVVNRKPDRFAILNLEGGRGFHGERVHLMAKGAKSDNGAELDGREHREFPNG